jgi:hypothetical protein
MPYRFPNRPSKNRAHIITTGTELARFIDALESMGDIPAFRLPFAQPELIQAQDHERPQQLSPDEIKSATSRRSSPKRSRAA